MLILTRKVGESINIGDEITVTILGVQGLQVAWASMHPKMFQCIVKKSTNVSRRNWLQTRTHNNSCNTPYSMLNCSV